MSEDRDMASAVVSHQRGSLRKWLISLSRNLLSENVTRAHPHPLDRARACEEGAGGQNRRAYEALVLPLSSSAQNHPTGLENSSTGKLPAICVPPSSFPPSIRAVLGKVGDLKFSGDQIFEGGVIAACALAAVLLVTVGCER